MRSALALLFLAACSQQPPQAELAGGEPAIAEMTYHCTPEGNEFIRVEYRDRSWEELSTGRACNYEEWRADVAANGPLYSRGRMQTYEQWRLAQGERDS